jgi:hypothetical protein
MVSHNSNILQEINGNGLNPVANFVSFSTFYFSYRGLLVANSYTWLKASTQTMSYFSHSGLLVANSYTLLMAS